MATPLWRIRNVTNVPHCGTRFLNPQESDAGSRSRHPGLVTISSRSNFPGWPLTHQRPFLLISLSLPLLDLRGLRADQMIE
jgi:hypothetical protein